MVIMGIVVVVMAIVVNTACGRLLVTNLMQKVFKG